MNKSILIIAFLVFCIMLIYKPNDISFFPRKISQDYSSIQLSILNDKIKYLEESNIANERVLNRLSNTTKRNSDIMDKTTSILDRTTALLELKEEK